MTSPVGDAGAGPRRNRVDPWGDLHAVPARGLFTGNRGCVVDDAGAVVRHHGSTLWIICLTSYRGWRWPLARPRRWTPLFFLDDAVALAAGHRPCGTCRRADHYAYRNAVTRAIGAPAPLLATELNALLHAQRHRRGRGIVRAHHRRLWAAPHADLPDGTVVVDDHQNTRLIVGATWWRFTHHGWTDPQQRPSSGAAVVLTPRLSVGALREGFRPALHHTADGRQASVG